ncbi:MAG TPA: AMP-binding protein, partial [Myxococcales bacterium]|nr:AMP-binding protein [Myxococcales bacterium]
MAAFRWEIPARFNMGRDVADRHGAALALIEIAASGQTREFRFDEISGLSNRLANVLVARGVRRGDRVAILLPQRHETAMAHVAAWKAGMISVPLFTLFGEEALEFRLQNSGAAALITDREQLPKLAKLRDRLPELKTILCVDGEGEGALDLHALLAQASDRFAAVDTDAEEPALIIYT